MRTRVIRTAAGTGKPRPALYVFLGDYLPSQVEKPCSAMMARGRATFGGAASEHVNRFQRTTPKSPSSNAKAMSRLTERSYRLV